MYSVVSDTPSRCPIRMAITPLPASTASTNAPARLPNCIVAFAAPGLPLPTLRMSMPRSRLPTMYAVGMLPSRYASTATQTDANKSSMLFADQFFRAQHPQPITHDAHSGYNASAGGRNLGDAPSACGVGHMHFQRRVCLRPYRFRK